MGNTIEGKTYVKGSRHNIQPLIASNIEAYKSQRRVSSSSNIHHTSSRISYVKANSSDFEVSKKPVKKMLEDIAHINE